MIKYRLLDQLVPAICLNRAAARLRQDCPSGKASTTGCCRDAKREKGKAGKIRLTYFSLEKDLEFYRELLNRFRKYISHAHH